MARIEFRSLTKNFGDVIVLPDMNLTIEDGEFVALLGPSGCGKSTSLFLLAGIYLPSGGDILFDGHVVNEVEARDRNVGIVFQSYALYPHMSVRDNILFPLRFKKTPREEALRRVKEAADLVHVGELLDRKPSELSGGQQQRVALARALVKEPQLLLLDEPLSNLDATLRLTMRTEIKSLQEKLGVTTVLVTHDQIEATTMADRIICMRGGRIEQVGTPDDLYLRPKSVFIASFIGSPPINMIEATVRDGSATVNGVALPLAGGTASGEVKLGLRPEHLAFSAAGLPGRVAQIEPMGREILYVVETGVGHVRVLEHGSKAVHNAGETVHIGFLPDHSLVFDAASERLLEGVRVRPPA
jgi:inositol-phosphate transport system ATP-binding protein